MYTDVARITAECQHHQKRHGSVPRWDERGLGERFSRVEQLEHRVQMLLGSFRRKGCCPWSSSRRTPSEIAAPNTSTSWTRSGAQG
jgi:hypothetical protein